MSRREGRDSDSRRHRSRFDEGPSPKRSRRDGKPAPERLSNNLNLDSSKHSDRDQKHHHRQQDTLPLEAPSAADLKVETEPLSKESDKKANVQPEGTKHSDDPVEVPRSRSFFQHDDRGKARQVGRSFSHRAPAERGWWRDSKYLQHDRSTSRTTNDMKQMDEKSQVKRVDHHAWRHDGYFDMEADPKPPVRKRPSFREEKLTPETENADKTAIEPAKPSHPGRPAIGTERREERGGDHKSRHLDRPEKPFGGDRGSNRIEARRSNFTSQERSSSAAGSYRGRERFAGRRPYNSSGIRVEKWKHDLFDEANKSPSPKNEEDQIARVEALLAS